MNAWNRVTTPIYRTELVFGQPLSATRDSEPKTNRSAPVRERESLPLVELAMGLALVAIALKTQDGSSFARTLVLFGLCAVITVYGFFRNPYSPFYCYAFAAPISKVFGIGFALILGGAVLVFLQREKTRWKWQFSLPGLLFCAWSVISLFWAEQIFTDLDSYVAQAIAPMCLALVMSGIRDPAFRRNIFLLVVAGCCIGSIFSFRNWSQGIGEMGSGGRIYSLIPPDPFSAWELFAIFGAVAWLTAGHPPRWLTWGLILSLPLLHLGLGLCGFRAAILACVVGFIVVSICRKRLLQGLGLGILAAIPVLALSLILPGIFKTVTGRFQTIQEDRGSDRLDIWNAALDLFAQHPVVGLGADNFKTGVSRLYGQEMLPHSIYVGTLAELGVIGLVLLLVWLVVLLRKAWRPSARLWLFPLLVAYLFQAAFLHQFYFICFWLAIGLVEAVPPRTKGVQSRGLVPAGVNRMPPAAGWRSQVSF